MRRRRFRARVSNRHRALVAVALATSSGPSKPNRPVRCGPQTRIGVHDNRAVAGAAVDGATQGSRHRGRARDWVPIEEICRLYTLSVDEFLAWERDIDRHGIHGLRSTRLQIYRDTEARKR